MGTHYRGVVFVADDEDDERALAQELLEDAGYLVLTARDGEEALARMRGIAVPAVAVVDLAMPRMSGAQLIAAMKGDPNLARIPVVVVTGSDGDGVQGATRVLRKPLSPGELLDVIAALF